MAEYKMCANAEMAIDILEFIKRGYEKNYKDGGVQKYIEALQMGIDALSADVAEVKQIEIVRDDLKWWLETNSEKGVVHIPKSVVENMIKKSHAHQKNNGNERTILSRKGVRIWL